MCENLVGRSLAELVRGIDAEHVKFLFFDRPDGFGGEVVTRGDVVAAINISGPITRLQEEVLERHASFVLAAARELSQALGYFKP